MQKLKNLQMKNMVKEIIQLNHHAIKLTFLWYRNEEYYVEKKFIYRHSK